MKRMLLAALICVNVALGAGLVLLTSGPQAALAQSTSLAQNYVVVAGEVRDQFDAVYLIDVRASALHGFLFDRATRKLERADSRDLERDFRQNREGGGGR